MFESLLFRPNFPTAPTRKFDFFTFPNDLEANNRNYYTEIQFYEYSSGSLGQLANATLDNGISGGLDAARNIYDNGFKIQQGIQGNALGHMKLPIPMRVNDSVSFSWGEESVTAIGQQLLNQFAFRSNAAYTGLLIGDALLKGAGVVAGYALNPLFFQTFQHQNFREFSFQWVLAPRTRTESATIANMITLLKRAATPAKALAGFALKYPAIAMIRFNPNDLNGGMKMKPCVITNVAVDHTPVAGPAFFKGNAGAPVVVGISISVKELQLWYREDYYDQETQSQISQNVPAFSGLKDDRQTTVTTGRDDRAPGTNP